MNHLVKPINSVKTFEGYHISYNPSSADYGCDTTAIVISGRVFFVLNGNHKKALESIALNSGLVGCLEYFASNYKQVNHMSEHNMALGLANDPFELQTTLLDAIGETVFNAIKTEFIG